MSATLEGLSELQKGFNDAIKKLGSANGKAFVDVTLDLLGKSIDLAPIDKGDLRGSGSAVVDNELIAQGGTSGADLDVSGIDLKDIVESQVGFCERYAVKQHEHTEYKHPEGGQAKYLEQPFRENIDKYIDHIADANRNALK